MAKRKTAKSPEPRKEYRFAVRTVTMGTSHSPGDVVPAAADIETLLRQGNIYEVGSGGAPVTGLRGRGNTAGASHGLVDTDALGRPMEDAS